MHFVLDASIALAWCFSDEATPTTVALLERLETDSAIVPALWPLEVGNILIASEKRKRITYANIKEFLALLEWLSIEIDTETGSRGFRDILFLAHSEQLTTYDATYLELAMRHGLPLATKDTALIHAAKRVGVKTI